MRIGIVGLGLIGGSLAGALRSAGHVVVGHDVDPSIEALALDGGFVNDISELQDLSGACEVIVLSMPVGAALEAIPEVAAWMKPDAILTDVAGVKRPVISAMESLPSSERCAGGHPVAGKETSGIVNADAHLFEGTPYALVPTLDTDKEVIDTLAGLARDVGAEPVVVDATAHDAIVGRTSHLPQVLSTALSMCLKGAKDDRLKGTGMQGMMRLARSDERLWAELLAYNSDNVSQAIRAFSEALESLATPISQCDVAAIESRMRGAREAAS